jgi:hypothetical protein
MALPLMPLVAWQLTHWVVLGGMMIKSALFFLVDFPTDLCSASQEKGRAGRWGAAGSKTDEYCACASLNLFLYLLK